MHQDEEGVDRLLARGLGPPGARKRRAEGTFRGAELADDRLEAKAPIFAFHLDGEPWAVPHDAFAGGGVFDLPDRDRTRLLERAHAGEPGFERLEGFDTFWYTWVGVNRDTHLLE